jgi:methionyl-tRNA synthetase
MMQSFLGGEAPAYVETANEEDQNLREAAAKTLAKVREFMDQREPHHALDAIMGFGKDLNQYIQSAQPWKFNKEGDVERVRHMLYHALEGIRWTAVLASAFVPDAAAKILAALGLDAPEETLFDSLKWGGLPAGSAIGTPDVLFEKIELEAAAEPANSKQKKSKKKKEGKNVSDKNKGDDSEKSGLIEFGDFLKVEIRVGRIDTAERVEGADKLLKLSADVGEEANRTIVAGLAKAFEPGELEGKLVAMVTNLKPAKLFGIKSEAMVLAVKTTDGGLELAFFSENVVPGTRIS